VRSEAKSTHSNAAPLSGSTQRYPSPFTDCTLPVVKRLGRVDYEPTWHAMREFTFRRTAESTDEIWVLEHSPVYTLGVAARPQHLPRVDHGVPVVKTDRGGQITYHGPGQLVAYLLLDMRRYGLTVRPLVRLMENAVQDLLAQYRVAASGRADAPGVYVGEAKIAALGLRIRNGCCYHGVALNVDMDLNPFSLIDPCGYPGLKVTQLRDLGVTDTLETVGDKLTRCLINRLRAI
jgi:lipoyl(octanoyl) transferase